MGFALPSGVVNNESAYFFADATGKLGPLVKQPSDQILVVVDYSKLTPPLTVTSFQFALDVTSNPQLVVSLPQLDTTGTVLSFLISGGIEGQQYALAIGANGSRGDVLTINLPSSGDCECETINPVPPLYTQSPLGTSGYVNSGTRYFWGPAPPSNPNVLDQWFNTDTDVLSEWVTDGVNFLWNVINGSGGGGSGFIDAPADGHIYSRQNGHWTLDPIQQDAPADNKVYARQNNSWVLGGGGGGGGANTLLNNMETLLVSSVNVVAPLSFTPSGGLILLIVNGQTFTPDDGSFTLTGNAIHWVSGIYAINPGDTVVAVYSYAPASGAPLNLFTNQEVLTVPVTNTMSDLSLTPAGGLFLLIVNGSTFTPDDGSFTISGKTIHWASTVYAVNPGDIVVAVYSYTG